MSLLLASALGSLLASATAAPPTRPPEPGGTVPSLEALIAAWSNADAAGDVETAARVFREIRRVRVERNIESHEGLGLALVARGQGRLEAGDREGAEQVFRSAVAVAPHLPDVHFGLARALARRSPVGFVTALRVAASGLVAHLATLRGRLNAWSVVTVVGLLTAFAVILAAALALLLRHGGLLVHDFEEWLGPGQRWAAFSLTAATLLLPAITFQGWGWLPLWWLVVLFVYCHRAEKVVALALLACAAGVGPILAAQQIRLQTAANPLFWAAVSGVEDGGDPRAGALLEEAGRGAPEDRDLRYLRGQVERKRGRYDAAATIYRQMLDRDGADAVARNNLANIEFARGDFASALSRYREGAAAGGPPEVVATSYYNLSLTHLQKFEYQPATEARSNADRLAGGRIDEYDRLWKYDSGDYAVVDLGLTEEQVWRKFEGRAGGTGVPNVAGTPARTGWVAVPLSSLGNRFAGFALAALLVIAALQRLRGPRAFTLHCQRCGTAFCRRCHLGSVVGGLCSQCYHLYVVRDGVSSPARNRKMTEVGQAEQRRRRIVRVLSVLSPGAGHTFAGHPLFGTVYLMAWYGLLAAIFVPGRLASFTEAPSRLQPWWPLVVAVAGLVLVWGLANRFQPDFGLSVALRRPGARRGRAA